MQRNSSVHPQNATQHTESASNYRTHRPPGLAIGGPERAPHTRDELRSFDAASAAVRLINREVQKEEKPEIQAKPRVKPPHCTGVFTRLTWRTLCFNAGGEDERCLCAPCLQQRGAEDALRAPPLPRDGGIRRRDSFPPTTSPPVRCWCSPGRGYRCESCTEQDNHLRYGSSTPPAGS